MKLKGAQEESRVLSEAVTEILRICCLVTIVALSLRTISGGY